MLRLLCLGGLMIGTHSSALAQTSGTWSGLGGSNGAWSIGSNWLGGAKPTGPITPTVYFGATSGTTIVNQDLATTFTLNRLTITNLNAAGVSSFTFTGGALRFEGSGAAISVQSPSTTTQTIYNQLILGSTGGLLITSSAGNSLFVIQGDITSSQTGNVTLTLAGASNQTSYLNGLIGGGSGTMALFKMSAGPTYVLSNVNNSFSGDVTVGGGTLVAASMAHAGQNSALGKGLAIFLGGSSDGTLVLNNGGGATSYSTNRNVFLNSSLGSFGAIQNDSADPGAVLTLTGGVISTSASDLRLLVLTGTHAGANTINDTIGNGSGTLGISKRGTGLWVLSGNNTFSGGTTIVAGALRVTNFAANIGAGNVRFAAASSNQGVLEASGVLTATVGTGAGQISWQSSGGFAAGATDLTVRLNQGVPALTWNSGAFVGGGQRLQLGSATSQGTVTLENGINLADAARTIHVFDGAAEVDAVISGSLFSTNAGLGELFKLGEGTLRLTADNTYAGFTTIFGTLILGNNGASGNLAGPVYTSSGGILAFNRNDSITFASAISGSGGVRVLTGTVTLSAANTFTGGATVTAGATLIVRGPTWPTVGDVRVAGGTLTFTDAFSRSVAQTYVTNSGVINIFSGPTMLTQLDLGNGTLNLVTSSASIQNLTLGSGAVVTISNGRSLVALTNRYGGPGDLTNTPQIQFNGTGSTGALISGSGGLILSGTTVWLEVGNAAAQYDLTIDAPITKSGTNGISKYGAGTLYLPSANPGLKNDLSLINGDVVIGDDRSLGDAEFRFATNSSQTGLAASTTAALRSDGAAAYTLTNNIVLANLLHYTPQIAGSGNLTLSGAVTNSDDRQTLLLSLDAGHTLTLNRLVLSNDTSAKTLTLGGSGFSVIRQIDGGSTATVASHLIFNGTGTVLLTGSNGYRGGTTIQSGTILVTGSHSLGNLTATTPSVVLQPTTATTRVALLTAAALDWTRKIDVLAGVAGSTVTLGGSTAVTSTFSGNITFSHDLQLQAVTGGTVVFRGALTGSAGARYSQIGGGSVVLAGSLGNTGGLDVDAGTLHIQAGSQVVGNGQINVSGTLRADGDVQGLVVVHDDGVLKGVGSVGAVVVQQGGTLSVGNSVGTLTLDGDGLPGSAPSLQLNAGSTVVFEFNNATGTFGDPAGGWDYIDLTAGTLTLNATGLGSSKIDLRIDSLLGSIHGTAANFNAAPGTFNNYQTYYWKFIGLTSTNQIKMLGDISLNGRFRVLDADPLQGVFYDPDLGANGNPYARPESVAGQGTFKVLAGNFGQGVGLYIYYSAIPEPGSLALAGLGSLAAGWYGRRRRRMSTP